MRQTTLRLDENIYRAAKADAASRGVTLSYDDALILSAARFLGCEVVYSEDLNDGQDYGGVTVVNPFRKK